MPDNLALLWVEFDYQGYQIIPLASRAKFMSQMLTYAQKSALRQRAECRTNVQHRFLID